MSEYANFFQTLQTNYKVERHSAFFRQKFLLFPQNSALIRYDIQVKTHVKFSREFWKLVSSILFSYQFIIISSLPGQVVLFPTGVHLTRSCPRPWLPARPSTGKPVDCKRFPERGTTSCLTKINNNVWLSIVIFIKVDFNISTIQNQKKWHFWSSSTPTKRSNLK